MSSYAVTKNRILQYIGIILIIGVFAGSYWYFQVFAGVKTNVSPTGALTSGLVGYWTFDGADTTSTTVTDRGSGGNNGAFSGSPTVTQGKLGQALSFDGNDRISVPDADVLSPAVNDLTVSVWVKVPTNASAAGAGACGNTGRNILGKNGWEYAIENDSNSLLCFNLFTSTGTMYSSLSVGRTMNDGQWHLYTMTVDYGVLFSAYIDGVLVGSTTSFSGSMSNTTGTLYIGDRGDAGYFSGSIDEVRIYSTALTAVQIQSLYKAGQSDTVNVMDTNGNLNSGLAGYWKLDEGTGTSAVDSSINGNTGTLTNGPTWTTGQIGSAVDFEGNYITASIPSLGTTYTASAWIKSDSVTGNSIFFSHRSTSDISPVAFQLDHTDADIRFVVRDDAGNIATATYTAALSIGQWTHVVGVRSGNTITLYVNGIAATAASASFGTLTPNSMNIGAAAVGSVTRSHFFNGAVDEPRVYSRVLSVDEVAQLYRYSGPAAADSGLVGHWSFNGTDTTSTKAYDRSGTGNTGTLTNGPAVTEGKVGQALSFDGSNDYVNVLDIGFNAFTFSTWFYTTNNSQTGMIFGEDGGSGSGGPKIGIASGNFFIRVETNYDSTVAVPTAGTWHHMVVTRNGSNKVDLYVDGGSAIRLFSDVAQATSYGLDKIGCNGSTPDQCFSGKLDEVRVYNTALTAAQIQSLYKQGQSDEVNTGASQAQGTGRLDSGLAGYWKLDEGSGTSATDSSTNGGTSTLTNGPTWTTGQIGSAVSFDGTDDYIDTNNGSALDSLTERTYTAWIYPTSANGFIIAKASNGGGSSGFRLTSSTLQAWQANFNQWAVARSTSSTTVSPNTWSHVAMTYSHAGDKKTRLYLNGTEVAYSEQDTNADGVDTDSSYDFWIGRKEGINEMVDVPFAGNIDEARIYNRALSADEVAQLYRLNAPSGTDTSLKGYWSFNGKDVSSTSAYDRSGVGNTGTLTNGPTVTPGKIGQGLLFDGVDDYVTTTNATTTYQYPDTTFTVTGWFKKTGTSNGYLVTQGGCYGGWGVYLPSGTIQVQIRSAGSCGGDAARRNSSTTTLNDGAWHHFAAIVTTSTTVSASNDISIYIDGALNQGSIVRDGNPYAITSTNLMLGLSSFAGGYFSGSLDEMRVYNRALTEAEIKSLYSASR